MHVETNGVARIRHRRTGEIHEIDKSELLWVASGGDVDRQMGPETIYTAEIAHPELGDLQWELSEYPVGVVNHVAHDLAGHQLIEDFEFAIVDPAATDEATNNATDNARYFSENDDVGITADELSALSADQQVPYLTHWFFTYFEDPAIETPYNSREGGYQYIWGGPYNAGDELAAEFGKYASEAALEKAAEEIEADGIYDWAPNVRHPDRADEYQDYEPLSPLEELEYDLRRATRAVEAGESPKFGTVEERATRARMKSAFDELAAHLPPRNRTRGGIGDNNPPPDERFTTEELEEVRAAVQAVQVEVAKEEPNVAAVAEASFSLVRVAKYIGRKFDIAIDAMFRALGDAVGKAAGYTIVAATGNQFGLWDWLIHALSTVGPWINSVIQSVI